MSRSHKRRKFFEAKDQVVKALESNNAWLTCRVEADIRQIAQLYQLINNLDTNLFKVRGHIDNSDVLWVSYDCDIRYQRKGGEHSKITVNLNGGDFIEEMILSFGHFIRIKTNLVQILKASSLKAKLLEIEEIINIMLEEYKISDEFQTQLNWAKEDKIKELRQILVSLDNLGWSEQEMLSAWREVQIGKVMDA